MFGKFSLTFVALWFTLACIILSGCDGTTDIEQTSTGSNIGFPLPEKIRNSLAVNYARVEGLVTINDRIYQMERLNTGFQATVPDIAVNSELSINLQFTETLPDGRTLNLAETAPRLYTVGIADTTIRITEDQFSYSFDDDNDGVSNIDERNDNTDPFVPENAGTRSITVNFNLPQRIENPEITQYTALIANTARPVSIAPDNSARIIGVVPNGSTINIDIRLSQRYQGTPVLIAQALAQVDAGNQDQTVTFGDADFSFDFDNDGDGRSNIDEMQSGTNPFSAD